jgi:DNA-directed RNA polymerase specialized sigma24 family protein
MAHDDTTAGGPNDAFQTTHWSEIVRVQAEDGARQREVMGDLLAWYWKPVYSYLCRKGHKPEEAQDLAQGFFQEIVLGRDLVRRADRTKGRFRVFLLTALDRYATSVRRARTARKRSPEGGLVSLDKTDLPPACEPAYGATPEEAFNYTWASALLDRVLADVARECREDGKAAHWEVFRGRVLVPIMENAAPPPLPDLCAKHRLAGRGRRVEHDCHGQAALPGGPGAPHPAGGRVGSRRRAGNPRPDGDSLRKGRKIVTPFANGKVRPEGRASESRPAAE